MTELASACSKWASTKTPYTNAKKPFAPVLTALRATGKYEKAIISPDECIDWPLICQSRRKPPSSLLKLPKQLETLSHQKPSADISHDHSDSLLCAMVLHQLLENLANLINRLSFTRHHKN